MKKKTVTFKQLLLACKDALEIINDLDKKGKYDYCYACIDSIVKQAEKESL